VIFDLFLVGGSAGPCGRKKRCMNLDEILTERRRRASSCCSHGIGGSGEESACVL